ncbi:hypothetical protein JXO59_03465 [candidate division KSB1 bacterium]|nr:hypothetical protein [candidate division KSB1 bacterium]
MELRKVLQEYFNEYYGMFNVQHTDRQDARDIWRRILNKSIVDASFRQKLIQSPVKVLAQNGFVLPEGFQIKLVEEIKDTIYLPIPPYMGPASKEDRHE